MIFNTEISLLTNNDIDYNNTNGDNVMCSVLSMFSVDAAKLCVYTVQCKCDEIARVLTCSHTAVLENTKITQKMYTLENLT